MASVLDPWIIQIEELPFSGGDLIRSKLNLPYVEDNRVCIMWNAYCQ